MQTHYSDPGKQARTPRDRHTDSSRANRCSWISAILDALSVERCIFGRRWWDWELAGSA